MKRTSITLILICFIFAANAQLLWKISNNGLNKSSYILGTHHLASLSIIDSIAGFQEALNNTEQVYGEIDLDELNNPACIQKMQEAIMLPGDTTLHTLFTKKQYRIVAKKVKQLLGYDLSQMNKLKPSFLSLQIAVIMYDNIIKDYNPELQLDKWILAEAQKQGKKTGGLETMDFQTDLLFNHQSLQRQAEQLYSLLQHTDLSIKQAECMTTAYMSQDLNLVERASEFKTGFASDYLPDEIEIIIYDRNDNWVKLMPSIMKEGATLFVVGVLHLLGERGILHQLSELGYTVEAIH